MSVLVSVSLSVSFSFLSLLLIKVLINKVVSQFHFHMNPPSLCMKESRHQAAAHQDSWLWTLLLKKSLSLTLQTGEERKEERKEEVLGCLTTDKSLSCRGETVVRFTTIMSQNLRGTLTLPLHPPSLPPSLSPPSLHPLPLPLYLLPLSSPSLPSL